MSSSSSNSDSENDQTEFVVSLSLKEGRHINHPGTPNPNHATFAQVQKKKKWPEDLWGSGTLIYSLHEPLCCLGPPQEPGDRTLRFDSKFESGNLMFAYLLAPDVYHLVLEYDRNGSGSCQWFYFEMSNIRRSTKYQFYISGFHKNSGVYKNGSKVFWYSRKQFEKSGIGWSRGGSNYGYGVTVKKKKSKRATLQFQMKFPYDDDTVYMCYALPYTYTDLQNNIEQWKRTAKCSVQATVLCQTVGRKDCPRLTMTNRNSDISDRDKQCILLTGRIHPGESNGSYVLHGLIDFLVSAHPAASYLMDHYIFEVIPMINIDGVVEGCYRTDQISVTDLNRMWTSPDPVQHPVLCAVKDLVAEISKERKVAVYIDFHGHSRLHGTFAYGCPNLDDPDLVNSEKVFPRMLSYLSDAFSWGHCVFSFPKERKAASRIVMRKEFEIVQSFTIESSFGGIDSGPRANILYDEAIWKELGKKCGESIYHLVAKDTSPLFQFVSRELALMSRLETETKDDEAVTVDVQFAPLEPDVSAHTEVGMISRQRGTHGSMANNLLRLRQPTTFLTASAHTITDMPPECIRPRWGRMQFGSR